MPKFLAGGHYSEEEISRHLKKNYRILAGPNSWQQVCDRPNPEKTSRSCEGADFRWLSSNPVLYMTPLDRSIYMYQGKEGKVGKCF
jgi:hypothetical protein